MGTAHERKKRVLSFADVAMHAVSTPISDVQGYNQLGFEELQPVELREVTIENLAVSRLPQVKKIDGHVEWSCAVSYQRDLWNQEDYTDFLLHASHKADAASAMRLKMGDLVHVTGIAWEQRLDLRGGKSKTIHHLNVTDMLIIRRAPSLSAQRRRPG